MGVNKEEIRIPSGLMRSKNPNHSIILNPLILNILKLNPDSHEFEGQEIIGPITHRIYEGTSDNPGALTVYEQWENFKIKIDQWFTKNYIYSQDKIQVVCYFIDENEVLLLMRYGKEFEKVSDVRLKRDIFSNRGTFYIDFCSDVLCKKRGDISADDLNKAKYEDVSKSRIIASFFKEYEGINIYEIIICMLINNPQRAIELFEDLSKLSLLEINDPKLRETIYSLIPKEYNIDPKSLALKCSLYSMDLDSALKRTIWACLHNIFVPTSREYKIFGLSAYEETLSGSNGDQLSVFRPGSTINQPHNVYTREYYELNGLNYRVICNFKSDNNVDLIVKYGEQQLDKEIIVRMTKSECGFVQLTYKSYPNALTDLIEDEDVCLSLKENSDDPTDVVSVSVENDFGISLIRDLLTNPSIIFVLFDNAKIVQRNTQQILDRRRIDSQQISFFE